MTDLEQKILKAQDAYYNDKPIMTDEEFDTLWDRLKKENPDSTLLNKVGEDSSDYFNKEEHLLNMFSLEKVNTEDQFKDWWQKRVGTRDCVYQHKLDGISIELQYDKGQLQKAVTRGNGKVGDDITNNVLKMQGFPFEISFKKQLGVRGEIILEKSIFNRVYLPKGFANPRNMASGLAKQKEPKGCENLKILFYDCKAENHVETIGDIEVDKLNFLKDLGFEMVPYYLTKDPEKVIGFREDLKIDRKNLEYDIDGIVIKKNNYNEEDLNRARPQFQIAFKFDTITSSTRIKDIYWSVSGKTLTPVALLEPVEIEGAVVRKASLSNPDRLRTLRLRYDDVVSISRRGQIIPYVENVISSNSDNQRIPVSPEKYVDVNGVEWKVKDEGTRVIIEDKNFPQIKYHRIRKWLDKLDIKGFGDALLNKLFIEGWVKDISDLYTLDLEGYLRTTNLKKATQKAFDNLYKVKNVPLEKFIAGFDIEDIGEKIVKLVVDAGYDTLNKIENASINQLAKIEGLSDYRAKTLKDGITELKSEMFKTLNFVSITKNKVKEVNNDLINGRTFCFTGSLETMKRKEAQEKVEERGGNLASGVSKNVDFLVTNDTESGSQKNKKAKENNVKIISEQEFLSFLE